MGSRRNAAACVAGSSSASRSARPSSGPTHGQRACGPRVAVGVLAVRVGPQLPEPGEVGVRIEDDDLQISLQQQLLEHDAERVGLAGARLTAEEGVPPESAGIERERHAGCKQQLPDLEPGAPWGGLLEVRSYLVRRRRSHGGVVERRAVAAEDATLALGAADHDLRPVGELAFVVSSQLEGVLLADAERDDLAEPTL